MLPMDLVHAPLLAGAAGDVQAGNWLLGASEPVALGAGRGPVDEDMGFNPWPCHGDWRVDAGGGMDAAALAAPVPGAPALDVVRWLEPLLKLMDGPVSMDAVRPRLGRHHAGRVWTTAGGSGDSARTPGQWMWRHWERSIVQWCRGPAWRNAKSSCGGRSGAPGRLQQLRLRAAVYPLRAGPAQCQERGAGGRSLKLHAVRPPASTRLRRRGLHPGSRSACGMGMAAQAPGSSRTA